MKPYNDMTVSEKLACKRIRIPWSPFMSESQMAATERAKERLEREGWGLAHSDLSGILYYKPA